MAPCLSCVEQKEKDLELAARIGQGLLARNKALEERLVTVETELTVAHDAVTQLRHDLSLKGELLQIYTNDLDDSSPEGGETIWRLSARCQTVTFIG